MSSVHEKDCLREETVPVPGRSEMNWPILNLIDIKKRKQKESYKIEQRAHT